MGATAGQLPEWAVYAFAGLSFLSGALLVFVLGLIGNLVGKRNGAGDAGQGGVGGDHSSCVNCPSVKRVEDALGEIHKRIDQLLFMKAGGA